MNHLYVFKYFITMKNGHGYKATGETEEQTEINFTIQAKNKVTADRMMKAMINISNVENIDTVCVCKYKDNFDI